MLELALSPIGMGELWNACVVSSELMMMYCALAIVRWMKRWLMVCNVVENESLVSCASFFVPFLLHLLLNPNSDGVHDDFLHGACPSTIDILN